MALQNSDLFIVERAGERYNMTADQIADFVGAVRDFSAADIAARDALPDLRVGDRIFVTDATADADVDAGWAIYRLQSTGPNVFEKVQEQESLDVVISIDLGYAPGATSGTVTNSTGGASAVIPAVTSTDAGLATPAMLAMAHVAASAGQTNTTNPIVIDSSTQVATFNVAQLSPLP